MTGPDSINLPTPNGLTGAPRRVGIELEFAGLTEREAAMCLARSVDGDAQEVSHRVWEVETPYFGTCETYLDTRFGEDVERLAGEGALNAARAVVPVELVTAPFDPAHLRAFDEVVGALREAGAVGSREGILLGFGVHLNVEIADGDVTHLWRVLTAYALIEPYLRAGDPIDVSRRLLPFVAAYPAALVTALAAGCPPDRDALIALYLDHAPTRNHGLDMLPVFAHLDPDATHNKIKGGTATKPRPAYHFRLPDCRIDEADWSILAPWRQWLAVERLAAAPDLLMRLCRARTDWAEASALRRAPWPEIVDGMLGQAEGVGA